MHSEFAYFKFPCAVWLGILFGLLHVSLHRELSYLTKTRYMEVDSLPVEPACFLLFSLSLSLFFLKLCLPFLLKQLGGGKKKSFWNSPLSYWELYHYKLKSHLTKNIDIFLNMIQLIEGLN